MYWGGLGSLVLSWGALRWNYHEIATYIDARLLPAILLYVFTLTAGVGLAAEIRRWRREH